MERKLVRIQERYPQVNDLYYAALEETAGRVRLAIVILLDEFFDVRTQVLSVMLLRGMLPRTREACGMSAQNSPRFHSEGLKPRARRKIAALFRAAY
jgi:hypothetical protein